MEVRELKSVVNTVSLPEDICALLAARSEVEKQAVRHFDLRLIRSRTFYARVPNMEMMCGLLNVYVHQEVHCLAKDGSSRRVDIIAIDTRNDRAIIIDPTVRFETAIEQPVAVHEEKKTIYDPTIQYFRDYYHIQGQIEVFGLLFGARGTIPKFSVESRRNEDVLERVNEERMILKLIRKRKRNWLGHWLRRNCLLKDPMEEMVNGRRIRGGRKYQMIDNIKIYGSCERTKRKAEYRRLENAGFAKERKKEGKKGTKKERKKERKEGRKESKEERNEGRKEERKESKEERKKGKKARKKEKKKKERKKGKKERKGRKERKEGRKEIKQPRKKERKKEKKGKKERKERKKARKKGRKERKQGKKKKERKEERKESKEERKKGMKAGKKERKKGKKARKKEKRKEGRKKKEMKEERKKKRRKKERKQERKKGRKEGKKAGKKDRKKERKKARKKGRKERKQERKKERKEGRKKDKLVVYADFEKAIQNGISNVFPNAKLKGCRFHLAQSWWRKIQSLGLSAEFKSKESEIGQLLKTIFGLPLLAPQEVEDCFVKDFMAVKPIDDRLDQFFDYLLHICITPTSEHPPPRSTPVE
ncbi:hypothetical protein ANN_23036 [Periplaneta americana]|uniref:MULE transposase domain-containing protein n=1 Tax=Periplaneta americana TaxID=6978 RepID=A0ABQ8SJY8_PERAM|nr:hypothetical protein ANN_23036 [Periplaneta americana]